MATVDLSLRVIKPWWSFAFFAGVRLWAFLRLPLDIDAVIAWYVSKWQFKVG